jgi:Flp pilus assembly protein TadG
MAVADPQRKPPTADRAPYSPRAWLRDRRGATAVEFAMIAAPLTFMIFALIQLGTYFTVQLTLDNAVAAAARELRTGQIVADGKSDTTGQKSFLTAVCNNMSWLQSQCQSGASNSSGTQYLVVDVRTLSSFSGNSAPSMTSNGAMNTSNFCFYSGGSGSAVELRAFYQWQLLAPALISTMQTFSNGIAEIQSTQVFQIEPNGQTNSATTPC